MNTTDVTAQHVAYWESDESIGRVAPVTMAAPEGMAGCEPCQAVATEVDGQVVVRVPWKPSEIDLAHLAQGGTLWLSTWGGLPPHQIEVQAP